jgi:hypothetical protein
MDLLRRGGMGRLFSGVRAPSTLGIFLRAFTFGHVRQLDAVDSRFPPRPAGQAPILAGAERMVWLDVDDSVIQTYGYAKVQFRGAPETLSVRTRRTFQTA